MTWPIPTNARYLFGSSDFLRKRRRPLSRHAGISISGTLFLLPRDPRPFDPPMFDIPAILLECGLQWPLVPDWSGAPPTDIAFWYVVPPESFLRLAARPLRTFSSPSWYAFLVSPPDSPCRLPPFDGTLALPPSRPMDSCLEVLIQRPSFMSAFFLFVDIFTPESLPARVPRGPSFA